MANEVDVDLKEFGNVRLTDVGDVVETGEDAPELQADFLLKTQHDFMTRVVPPEDKALYSLVFPVEAPMFAGAETKRDEYGAVVGVRGPVTLPELLMHYALRR